MYSNEIKDAIKKGYHITTIDALKDATYVDFEEAVKGKRLYLYGLGNLALLFRLRYRDVLSVSGIIDGKPDDKKRMLASEIMDPACNAGIIGPEQFSNIDKSESVILILSIRYYEEIYHTLKDAGFDHVFSLLHLELNEYQASNPSFVSDHRILYDLFTVCKDQYEISPHKILFWIDVHGGHVRAITNELLKNDDLEIVWLCKKPVGDVPQGVKAVDASNPFAKCRELSRAKVILTDQVDMWEDLEKKEDQVVIQLKHWSSVTLKKFGLEDAARISEDYYQSVLHSSAQTDYIFTGSSFDMESCARGFGADIKCVDVGSPRSDTLFKDGVRKEVYQKLGIDLEYNTLLLSPTFRENADGDALYGLDLEKLYLHLKQRFGGEWRILIRLHPLRAGLLDDTDLDPFVRNVSHYPDIEELVAASDCMITDYSSVMFEPSFVGKPVFLFAPDKTSYINGEKELLLNYDTLPFPIAETNEQLAENILHFDPDEYQRKVMAFLDQYGVHEDGHASERAAEFILGLMK